VCQFFGGLMTRTINAVLACLSLFLSAGLQAAPALPLSGVEILQVVSKSGATEEVRGTDTTHRTHHGANIRVHVLERGYGGHQPSVTFNGHEVDGTRTPVCNQGEGLVTCNGAGTTVGYLYTFTLSNTDGGWFEFANTSLVPPHHRLSARLYIK